MRKKLLLVLSILVLASLVLGACGDGDATDAPVVTDAPEGPAVTHCDDGLDGETIKYYYQAGLTGPLSTILGTTFVNALNDAIAEVNADGGVCGATVELVLTDTQYDPEQEVVIYQTNREDTPPPFVFNTAGSGATIALSPLVNEDHIVNYAAGLNAQAAYVPRDGFTILVAPIYSDQFAGFLKWSQDNWADVKPEGAGDDMVVGVIGWEGPFGAGATTPEALAYADSLGITVLDLETFPAAAEADVITPLQSLALQGANVIYIQSLGFGTAQVIGTLQGMELWSSMHVGSVNWGMNQDVLTVLGDSAGAAIGMYGLMPFAWWNDTDVPGVAQARAAFEAGGYPEADRGVSFLTAYVGVFAWVETVEATIDRVGFENLTGDTFFETLQLASPVSVLGVWEYDVSGELRAPTFSQMGQVQLTDSGIEFVVIEEWFELPDTKPAAE
ncbi:MAG: ABC transporter substrate-binding protein [Chloroflexi bacterium]|nr:ABC transporter substrate-binding protein [Chloroflexota bacterium]